MRLEERIFPSKQERIWGIAGIINHEFPLYLKDMNPGQKSKLTFLFYLNALRKSEKNIAYLEYIRVCPPFNYNNGLEEKFEDAKIKNEIVGKYIKCEHSYSLGKRVREISRNADYSAEETRRVIYEHLGDDLTKKYLEQGIKLKSYAKTEGISESSLYKILGKGKIAELREKRKEFVYKRFKSGIFDNFNLNISDFCYRNKISTSTLYKMIKEHGDSIEKLRDGRSYFKEDKFKLKLENAGVRRYYVLFKKVVRIVA